MSHALWAVELLLYNRIITRQAAEEAIDRSQRESITVPEALRQAMAFDPNVLLDHLKKGMHLPVVSLEDAQVDESLIHRFPLRLMQREQWVPFQLQGQTLKTASPDPLNLGLFDQLTFLTGLWISPFYASQEDIQRYLNLLSGPSSTLASLPVSARPAEPRAVGEEAALPASASLSSSSSSGASPEGQSPASGDGKSAASEGRSKPAAAASSRPGLAPPSRAGAHTSRGSHAHPPAHPPARASAQPMSIARDLQSGGNSTNAVEWVNSILEKAIAARATDIHIEPLREGARTRMRIDGVLHNAAVIPAELAPTCISRIKVLGGMNVTERRRPQDGHFSIKQGQNSYDLRISALPVHHGEKIVIRILDASAMSKGIEDLGLWPEQFEILKGLLLRPHGMLLAVGPTGSGKTTSLYAILRALNREGVNIVTIEDPIEYEFEGVNQVQVDSNIEMGFAPGLRAILRQDPDVIMIGEIRDLETAQISVRASITGHLVLSTLHANTSFGAVTTLRQMQVPSYLISASMLGIISQRLLRKVCPHCAEDVAPDIVRLRAVGLEPAQAIAAPGGPETFGPYGPQAEGAQRIRQGKGCDQCFQSGFLGRMGIFEVVGIDDVLRRAILANASEQDLYQLASQSGLLTLQDSARQAVLNYLTPPEEIIDILLASAC